jgi:PiT family inorganic phosphate transporter
MTILILVIILALLFDVINGFHDAANSIATIVSTRVLRPWQAVIWAAFFNFIAYLVFGLHIANTVGKGIVHSDIVTLQIVLSGLTAAIIWNLITWWFGLPTSSSHTLMGGFVGAAIAHAGFAAVYYSEIIKIVAFIVLAPVIGFMIAFIIAIAVAHICKRMSYTKVDNSFKRLQLISAAAYSLGHGANDAQKVMGIIFVALVASGKLLSTDPIPFWVVISCQSAMAIGTLMGGWRIVKTMGTKITHLRPFEGFSAETGGALTLFGTSLLGIPVSTTHTITGAIVGVGSIKRLSAVRWGVTRDIILAWIITIPITSLLSALIYYLLKLIF